MRFRATLPAKRHLYILGSWKCVGGTHTGQQSLATKHYVKNDQKLIDYLKRHYGEWYNHAIELGYSKKNRDLVLVQGIMKTVEWTVAAVRSSAAAQSA